MNEEQLQAAIDALPREHEPRPYEVLLFDKRDRFIARRYVRASSPKRARLTGLRVNLYVFGQAKSYRASAWPDGWTPESIAAMQEVPFEPNGAAGRAPA